jgi:CheY-like chemotaxis protein
VIASPLAAPTQLRQAQQIVERQVNHMALLLDDLLDIARITQGKLQLKKETLALIPVVDAAVEAVRPTLDGKNQQLELNLPHEPILLDADHLRLSQVISNLLMNAVKYSDPGKKIELTCAVHGDMLKLSIKDEGIGIAPDSMPRIFDMFSQVDSVSRRSEGGLGIGLALVKGITELHGGSVEARSQGLGSGSEFIVQLPIAARPKASVLPAADAQQAPSGQRRILVADDNRDAAESLAMLLEMAGHEVRVAHHGQAALSLAQSFRPDTALLDIGMPDISGYEVAQSLRREPWGAKLLLVALTGWGQDGDKRRAVEAGFDHHLIKPVDPDLLAEMIAKNVPAGTFR